MKFELRKEFRWALVVPTSMGVRITPVNSQPVHCTGIYAMQVTSAETNVASVSSFLGLPVKVLTAFVKCSPVARLIKDNLAGRHMAYEGIEVEQGGPWGYRHQFNIADSGYGTRGPRVFNDRAGEVGRILSSKYFDLDRLFVTEGVRMLHISGLVAALSHDTAGFCLDLARKARENGTVISFDLNYRASFWKNREGELREIFRQIAGIADILVGNEEDFQLSLGIEGPEAGGKDLAVKTESFREMIYRVRQSFPGVSVFATTLREVLDANEHLWGAVMLEGETWHIIEPRHIRITDRIGGGDGFVGGLLYGILKEWEPEKCLQFGWAGGALATTLLTDYCQPADEEQVWSIWNGNARVQR
jgi:2-dehydro-3-deoxygluconokinase